MPPPVGAPGLACCRGPLNLPTLPRICSSTVSSLPEVGVTREELRRNAKRLGPMVRCVDEIMQERCISGCSQGINDVIDSPAKVRRWHERLMRKRQKSKPALQQRRDHFGAKLRELFPELREAPRG